MARQSQPIIHTLAVSLSANFRDQVIAAAGDREGFNERAAAFISQTFGGVKIVGNFGGIVNRPYIETPMTDVEFERRYGQFISYLEYRE